MSQIGFLPYLEIKREFEFDNIIFWPFWRLKSRRIKEKNILKYLEWYFKKWRDNVFEKRLNITTVSLEGKLLGPFSGDEVEKIQAACNVLFLLSAPKNDEFAHLASDNFMVYFQNFSGGEYRLALETGSYIREQGLLAPQLAKKIRFIKPDFILKPKSDYQPWLSDRKYILALQRAFRDKFNEAWFARLRRSLTSFVSSYSNGYSINYFDRIILLVTSIEILLDIDKPRDFVKTIESTLGFSNIICRRSHSFARINRDIRSFSDTLYKIRSKYVHGEVMSEEDIRHPHLGEYYKTGVILFYELVRSLLEKHICLRKRKLTKKYFDLYYGLFRYRDENQQDMQS